MALEILRDIGGLRIEVMHPPDADGTALVEHLRRIGCRVDPVWADAGGARRRLGRRGAGGGA